ncbi:MAG TPA: cobalamin-dependent protein [Thermoguttaceae bacterium]|nr:cobalamin-dependent protein [Thermoguttaceae bacterium]
MAPRPELDSRRRGRFGKVRVLFGATGWPCGVLEIASWAKREGLADAVVVPVLPGYAFRLAAEDRPYVRAGSVDPEVVDSFARHQRPLSNDAVVRRAGQDAWEIRDRARGWTYRVVDAAEGLDVYVLESYESPESIAIIRRFAQSRSLVNQFFEEDGAPSETTRDALAAVGGQFITKLIEFAPHVVGFRLEGGRFDQVKRFIRAVRLFSDAEVVLGGPTATSHPREVLEDCGADYVFAGEAEEPFNRFLRLARERNSKDRQPEIPGLAYRYGGRIHVNTGEKGTQLFVAGKELRPLFWPVAPRELIAANRLDWSLLEGFERVELDSLFFTAGRGCPGACTFCAKLHGQEVRVKGARQLLAEIEAADAKVAAGEIRVTRWPLFEHCDDPELQQSEVAWAAVYDEDFFLHRRRAIEFFRLWAQSPLRRRYRLSLQTNPCSMLTSDGRVHAELLRWIDSVKPMVQLGAESFNRELLARWRKRHNVDQLNAVLDALDTTRQDYTVFQLLTDFDTTPEELVETLRLLILNAYRHRRMRIASSPFTIPLYDSETRRLLEYRGLLTPDRVGHFTDYERPQPGWMDPLAAELADLADAELRWTLQPQRRDAALLSAFEVVLDRICEERDRLDHAAESTELERLRIRELHDQAERAMNQIKDARFQGIGPFGR